MIPDLYTVEPDEPPAWVAELDLIRDTVLAGGEPLLEAQKAMAARLADLRFEALKAYNRREPYTPYEDYSVPVNGNGHHPKAAPEKHLPVESWMDFRDNAPEDITYLVNGLVPEGSLMFLAGAPKAGKTWIGLGLGLSCASGRPFLGRFIVPKATRVLYLALEGHRSAIRARIGAMARGMGVDPETEELEWLHLSYRPMGLDLSDPAWTDDVIAQVGQLSAQLVIVDVLRAAAPQLKESGEGAHAFAQIRSLLSPLMAGGVTVCLLHHFIKSGETAKGRGIGERMSGSGALFGHADLVLGITGKDERTMRLEVVSRDSAAPDPFGVMLDGNGSTEFGGFGYQDTLRVIATDDVPAATADTWEKLEPIVEWMKQQQGRISPKKIRDRFDTTNPTLHRYRADLESRGVYHYEEGRLSGYEYHPSTPPWRGSGEVSELTPPPLHPRSGSGGVGDSDGEVGDIDDLRGGWEA